MTANETTYMKEYYKNNKAKYQEYYNIKVKCDVCNSEYSKLNFSKHIKTNKHIRKIDNKNNNKFIITEDMYNKLVKVLESTK